MYTHRPGRDMDLDLTPDGKSLRLRSFLILLYACRIVRYSIRHPLHRPMDRTFPSEF